MIVGVAWSFLFCQATNPMANGHNVVNQTWRFNEEGPGSAANPSGGHASVAFFGTFSTCSLFVDNLLAPPVCGEWRRGAIFPTKCFGAKDFGCRQREDQKWRVASTPHTEVSTNYAHERTFLRKSHYALSRKVATPP